MFTRSSKHPAGLMEPRPLSAYQLLTPPPISCGLSISGPADKPTCYIGFPICLSPISSIFKSVVTTRPSS